MELPETLLLLRLWFAVGVKHLKGLLILKLNTLAPLAASRPLRPLVLEIGEEAAPGSFLPGEPRSPL